MSDATEGSRMIAQLIAKLVVAGTPPELVAEVAVALARAEAMETALEGRRSADRARKTRERAAAASDVTGCHVTSRDSTDITGQKEEKVSGLPKEEISQVPTEPSRRAPARVENPGFSERFWPAYPHKVGKPAASKAYSAAKRRGATDDEIAAGLSRYIREKPPDRQWLNPATFLNQDRFNDQPSEPVHGNRTPAGKPRSSADGLLSAFGRLFGEPEGGGRGGPRDPPGGDGADAASAARSGGLRGEAEIIAPRRGH